LIISSLVAVAVVAAMMVLVQVVLVVYCKAHQFQ
jgi:hypothetical protein